MAGYDPQQQHKFFVKREALSRANGGSSEAKFKIKNANLNLKFPDYT